MSHTFPHHDEITKKSRSLFLKVRYMTFIINNIVIIAVLCQKCYRYLLKCYTFLSACYFAVD